MRSLFSISIKYDTKHKCKRIYAYIYVCVCIYTHGLHGIHGFFNLYIYIYSQVIIPLLLVTLGPVVQMSAIHYDSSMPVLFASNFKHVNNNKHLRSHTFYCN